MLYRSYQMSLVARVRRSGGVYLKEDTCRENELRLDAAEGAGLGDADGRLQVASANGGL